VAQIELTRAAVEDLDRLIAVLTLPADTRERVRSCLQPLREFPRLGAELTGRWLGLRFLIGPWRWMLLVYEYHPETDRVVILTVQDARSSSAATSA
jgi:plasmid stabilization system protein ParE